MINKEGLDVYLIQKSKTKASSFNDYVENVEYTIMRSRDEANVGRCDIRIGENEELYYAGNIGYRIYESYRGNSYAYQACLILFDILKKEYNINELKITCSPNNIASKKTIEKLGAEFIEECEVPKNHYLYLRGEKIKRIYTIKL